MRNELVALNYTVRLLSSKWTIIIQNSIQCKHAKHQHYCRSLWTGIIACLRLLSTELCGVWCLFGWLRETLDNKLSRFSSSERTESSQVIQCFTVTTSEEWWVSKAEVPKRSRRHLEQQVDSCVARIARGENRFSREWTCRFLHEVSVGNGTVHLHSRSYMHSIYGSTTVVVYLLQNLVTIHSK